MKRSESTEQMTLIDWCNINTCMYPELESIYHIPNEWKRRAEKRSTRFMSPSYSQELSWLYIEMKYGNGRTSKEQKEWIDKLNAQCYKEVVCNGFEEARKTIEKYMASQQVFKMKNKKNEFKELKGRLFNHKENKTKLESKLLKLENLDYQTNIINLEIKGRLDNKSKVEKYVIEKEVLEKEIKELSFYVREVDIDLNILTKKEYNIIDLRYFEGYKSSEVYNRLHMSESTFWREHN